VKKKAWVDNEVYFGPDRRNREGGKRWGDRRHFNDAGEPPSLGNLLRRLRVLLMDSASPDRRQRALQVANLAIFDAEELGLRECAARIREASRHINSNARDAIVAADALLIEAQALAQPTQPY
jgi:hypothetical protein